MNNMYNSVLEVRHIKWGLKESTPFSFESDSFLYET